MKHPCIKTHLYESWAKNLDFFAPIPEQFGASAMQVVSSILGFQFHDVVNLIQIGVQLI